MSINRPHEPSPERGLTLRSEDTALPGRKSLTDLANYLQVGGAVVWLAGVLWLAIGQLSGALFGWVLGVLTALSFVLIMIRTYVVMSRPSESVGGWLPNEPRALDERPRREERPDDAGEEYTGEGKPNLVFKKPRVTRILERQNGRLEENERGSPSAIVEIKNDADVPHPVHSTEVRAVVSFTEVGSEHSRSIPDAPWLKEAGINAVLRLGDERALIIAWQLGGKVHALELRAKRRGVTTLYGRERHELTGSKYKVEVEVFTKRPGKLAGKRVYELTTQPELQIEEVLTESGGLEDHGKEIERLKERAENAELEKLACTALLRQANEKHRLEQQKNRRLYELEKHDRAHFNEVVQVRNATWNPHYMTDDVPYAEFTFTIFNGSVYDLTIEESVGGYIEFASKRLMKDVRLSDSSARSIPHGKTARVRAIQWFDPTEVAAINKAPDTDMRFAFGFDKLVITVSGEDLDPRPLLIPFGIYKSAISYQE